VIEVQEALQDCLRAVADFGGRAAAQEEARRARKRAEAVLEADWEQQVLSGA
jgi:hypothetical protein